MKFGQYELLERIAVGGMAEVYRGRVAGAEGFEKLVAIKRVLPEFARDERFISMLLTEARIHSALSHRNIVQIHDLGISEDGEYFIVLEYVEGHDLRAVIEAATSLGVQIPDSIALHIADEVAQALQFAHELKDAQGHALGIIHRDVSPSNILLSNSGEVKLSDFGLAKRQQDQSVVGALKGNLVYMSPEQARKATVDRRTDVFSLGAVLFEMLTGQKLRDVTNEVDGWRDVAAGKLKSARDARPDLPDGFVALLARALAVDPANRFPDAASFGAAIRELGREGDAPAGANDIKELLEVLESPAPRPQPGRALEGHPPGSRVQGAARGAAPVARRGAGDGRRRAGGRARPRPRQAARAAGLAQGRDGARPEEGRRPDRRRDPAAGDRDPEDAAAPHAAAARGGAARAGDARCRAGRERLQPAQGERRSHAPMGPLFPVQAGGMPPTLYPAAPRRLAAAGDGRRSHRHRRHPAPGRRRARRPLLGRRTRRPARPRCCRPPVGPGFPMAPFSCPALGFDERGRATRCRLSSARWPC